MRIKTRKKKLSVSELYAILTQQLHFPPDYVLDKMEWYEINAAMKYNYYSSKSGWEQARLVAYMIAQVNSRRTLQMEDIVKFPWENEDDEQTKTSITKEEIEHLQREAEKYLKTQNKTVEKRVNING